MPSCPAWDVNGATVRLRRLKERRFKHLGATLIGDGNVQTLDLPRLLVVSPILGGVECGVSHRIHAGEFVAIGIGDFFAVAEIEKI